MNLVGKISDEVNFAEKQLLCRLSDICVAFANHLPAIINMKKIDTLIEKRKKEGCALPFDNIPNCTPAYPILYNFDTLESLGFSSLLQEAIDIAIDIQKNHFCMFIFLIRELEENTQNVYWNRRNQAEWVIITLTQYYFEGC